MREFLKLLKKDLTQSAGFGVLAFLFIIFGRLVTYTATLSDAIESYKRYPEASLNPIYTAADYMGVGNLFHPAVVIVLGCCFALLTCYYLHGRKTVDFYHSLPLRKTTVFGVKYLSGIIMFALGYAVNFVMMTAVTAAFGVLTSEAVLAGLASLANGIFGFAFIYSVGVLAGLLTATVVTHFVMGTILMFILPCAVILWDSWNSLFYVTYLSEIPLWAYCLSPIVYLAERCTTAVIEDISIFKATAVMAAGFAVFTLINFGVCRLRRSEAAGRAIAFKELDEPLRVVFSLFCGVMGGFMASFMFGFNEIVSFIAGFFVVLVVSSLIIEVIFRFDFTAAIRNKRYLGVSLVLGAVMIGGTVLSVKGYNTYVPGADRIVSAAVSLPFLQNDETCKVKNNEEIQYFNAELLKIYDGEQIYAYADRESYTFDNMEVTDGELLAKLFSACAEEYEDLPLIVRYDDEEEIVSDLPGSAEAEIIGGADEPTAIMISDEEEEEEDIDIYVNIKCTLKSGRTYYRTYKTGFNRVKDILGELFENSEYKKGLWGSFYDMNPEEIKGISVDNSYNFHKPQYLNFGAGEAQKIYEALEKDTARASFEEAVTVSPLCEVYFYNITAKDYLYYMDYFQAAGMYVYPSYENTIAVLSELGVKFYSEEEIIDNIDSIVITDYDTGISEAASAAFTDREEISEIFRCIYPQGLGRLIYTSRADMETEIYTKTDKDTSGYSRYPSYNSVFNSAEEIPDFVKERLAEQEKSELPG